MQLATVSVLFHEYDRNNILVVITNMSGMFMVHHDCVMGVSGMFMHGEPLHNK